MVVYNPKWLQMIFFLAIAGFPCLSIYMFYLAYGAFLNSGISGAAVLILIGGGGAYISYIGILLAKFVPAKVEFDDAVFKVTIKNVETVYKWGDIASVKNYESSQILKLFDINEQTIYVVDHMTPGYTAFVEKVNEVSGIYVDRKDKDVERRQCSYGCVRAFDVLENINKYDRLKDLFETLSSHSERYFYAVCSSRNMSPQTLEQWTNDFPSSGDALLCYGARLLQWSWSARGYGRGTDVSEEQWQEFFNRLDKTRDVLLECAKKSPEDPTPWAYLIMVSTWYSDPDETKYQYFNEAVTRDPENWAAHMHMIIALSEKWGGSNDEMIEFARNASNKAPVGSDLKVIVVKAYIEHWKYLELFEDKPEEANAFISDENIQNDVIDAYDKSLGLKEFSESNVTIFARYNLSGWFWITRDKPRLKAELSTLGNKIEDIHWRWVCTEGRLQDAWDFVNESE